MQEFKFPKDFVWSFWDNFEWQNGRTLRFGLVYVDYNDLKRVPKSSAYWYSDVIKNNGFVALPESVQGMNI